MKRWLLAVAVGFLGCMAVTGAETEKFVITKSVRQNPTLYFAGVPGRSDVERELRSILTASGWFDVVTSPQAAYTLSSRNAGGRLVLQLTLGGAPIGSWYWPEGGSARQGAKQIVDTIIEKSFKELKVRGFCQSRIAFCAETQRGIRNVYACDIDGGELEQITMYRTLCVEPCWFPDGRSIGYSRYHRTGMDVVQTNLAPRQSRVLSALRGINAGAAISPDGRQLAMILSPDHQVDLYVKPIAGGTMKRLTRDLAVEASPCWSPDGRSIVYVSDAGGAPRLYVRDLASGSSRRLPTVGYDAVTPDWSKDNKIVYATRVKGYYTIAVYDLNSGENKVVLTTPGNWESPAWAADNRQVVCKRQHGRHAAIYVVDTWTGRYRLLITTNYNLSMPAWSPCAARER